MNRKAWPVCVIVIAVCLWFCTGNAQQVMAQNEITETDSLFHEIDLYLQSCAERAHIPSMSVTITDKDNVLFSKGYGSCEDCDTPFVLGSVSKSFTAVCVMQLVEQGKIDLGAPISVYLPDAPCGGSITVSQLLNHTSGLGEHQTLENAKIVTEQGAHSYANVNYSLLGEIIEAVSGQSYHDYITEHLFEPLSLSQTAAGLSESEANGLIDGYTGYWGIAVKNSHKYPPSKNAWITVPAGYLSSSANDLGKYLQMYLNGGMGILSKQSIDTMFYGDTVYVDDTVPFWYGYGWATVKEPLSEPVLRHSGLVETGTAVVFIIPESGLAVAITCNVNDYFVTNEMMDSLGWGVVLMLLGQGPNEIGEHAYVLSHFRINMIMLAVFAAALLPFFRLFLYAGKRKRDRKILPAGFSAFLELLFAVLVLLIVPVCFRTPLWVAKAFVPDVFWTVVVSAALFFVGGAARFLLLILEYRKKPQTTS